MNRNRLVSNPDTKPNFRNGIKRIVAVAALAGVAALAAACSPRGGEAVPVPSRPAATAEAAPQPQQTAETARKIAEKQAKERLQQRATSAALSVLGILSDPKSGSENYKQHYVGNKRAIVGPDEEYGTADDAKYRGVPEAFATFYPETSQILVTATGMRGKDTAPLFTSVETVFKVDASNPIARQTGQLTVADFQKALRDTDSVSVVAATARHDQSSTKGFGAGVWLSPVGVVPDSYGSTTSGALEVGLPAPNEVLTDPAAITSEVTSVTGALRIATHDLSRGMQG